MKILEVKNLSFRYKNAEKYAFSEVSFDVHEGELILVCGATAGGKTTLLRCLKPELSPNGNKSGEIIFCGEPLEALSEADSASKIGYVMQRPENQTVTDSVRSELAFGGESLGLSANEISRQIAESAAYFGLERLLSEKTSQLSGGQRQLLNLAAVMAVNPRLVVLDEPTAQLDPIAAGSFIRTLHRIARELSVTIIIAEHRFEELLPLADKVLLLEEGHVFAFGAPSETIKTLAECSSIAASLPSGIQLYSEFSELSQNRAPLTLGESRALLDSSFNRKITAVEHDTLPENRETAIRLREIYFAYETSAPDVISATSVEIGKGEIFSLLGSNGSGKSTLLSVMAGLEKPYRGAVEILGKPLKKYKNGSLYQNLLAYLPQDVQSSFMCDSVGEELEFTQDSRIYDFSPYYDMHPYDLSGGQQQLLGLKKLVMSNPRILLLDEPTKGLDGSWRNAVADAIKELRSGGMTVFIVTHDTELAAMVSDRCGIFFDGRISAVGPPHEIFADSMFYTTNAAKTARGIYSGVCTTAQLIGICAANGLRGE